MSPLVTVVTSTWARPTVLIRHAVNSVAAQDYPDIQHIVVIDGYDKATEEALADAGYTRHNGFRRFIELGRNWSGYSGDGGFGATCRIVGAWLGSGEYITYLDDDAEYAPTHVSEMVALMDTGVDFATSSWTGSPDVCPCPGPPPGLGRTDTSGIMHKAMLLKEPGTLRLDGYAGDGYMVERWLAAGLTWAHKDTRTLIHPIGSNHGAPLG